MLSNNHSTSSIPRLRTFWTNPVFLVTLIVIFHAVSGWAHNFPFSTLELRIKDDRIEGTLDAHVNSFSHPIGLPAEKLLDAKEVAKQEAELARLLNSNDGLHVIADGKRLLCEMESVRLDRSRKTIILVLRYPLDKKPSRMDLECYLFTVADPSHETYLRLYDSSELAQNTFTSFAPKFTYWLGHTQAKIEVFKQYLHEGVHHIFTGYDHIAFIIGLLLLGGTIGRLAKIVTAFTIAHSITLTLAALGTVQLSPKFVEPAIALSIMYIGADNLVRGEGRDIRALLAFFFGFIHGFGFAGVLRETGLPQHALGLSLFSFNLGVEFGQLCIVLLITPLFAAIRKRNGPIATRLATAGSYAIIIAGGYWFVQRTFFA